ncbi:MAG TPA: hypothetical protein VLA15_07025, partial [Desulfurivibrionaceae bacterium]|nr:hypothetical protein [Desulfurivibrionaceae bacterium]
EVTADREDAPLIRELLGYDWLRCGHRYLPEALGATADLAASREALSRRLPLNFAPHYDYQGRADFLRKSMFMHLSGATARFLGLGAGGGGMVAILPEKTDTLQGFRKTLFFSDPD